MELLVVLLAPALLLLPLMGWVFVAACIWTFLRALCGK